MADESAIVSVGSAILTDIAALLLLAVSLGMGRGNLSPEGLISLLLGIAVFALLVVWGTRWSARSLIQLGLSDEDHLFLAVLLALYSGLTRG